VHRQQVALQQAVKVMLAEMLVHQVKAAAVAQAVLALLTVVQVAAQAALVHLLTVLGDRQQV
jgi:hypothetical protein